MKNQYLWRKARRCLQVLSLSMVLMLLTAAASGQIPCKMKIEDLSDPSERTTGSTLCEEVHQKHQLQNQIGYNELYCHSIAERLAAYSQVVSLNCPQYIVINNLMTERILRDLGGREKIISNLLKIDELYNRPRFMTPEVAKSKRELAESLKGRFNWSEQFAKSHKKIFVKNDLVGLEGLIQEVQTLSGQYHLVQDFPQSLKTPLPGKEVYGNDKGIFRDYYQALDHVSIRANGQLAMYIPGNNDLSNAAFAAKSLMAIKTYLLQRNLEKVRIKVIIMGKGGHPTTADSPSIGEIAGKTFIGIPEALGLEHTLRRHLGKLPDHVEIVPKGESTNTAENVNEAKSELPQWDLPDATFVVAAKTASGRQFDTFAHQLVDENRRPLYKNLFGITPRRSREDFRSRTDFQVVYHYLQSLSERARRPLYEFNLEGDQTSFLGISPLSPAEVRELYSELAAVHQLDEKEAAAIPLSQLLRMNNDLILQMEYGIPLILRLQNLDGAIGQYQEIMELYSQITGYCLEYLKSKFIGKPVFEL